MNDREQFEAWYADWVKQDGFGAESTKGQMFMAFQAARATPAQPDSKLLVDIATGVMEERSMLSDMNEDHVQLFCDHLKEAFDRAAFIPSPASASPSTVAEAIRKLPLGRPANEAVFADGTTHIFIYKDSQRVYTEATVRRLLSEAAALAEQVQEQEAPDLQRITDAIVSMREFYLGMLASSLRNDRADAFDKTRRKDITKMVREIVISELAAAPVAQADAAPFIAQDGQKSEGV